MSANNSVPVSCNESHWIHGFAENFKSVRKLELVNCGCEPKDLSSLRVWLPNLAVEMQNGMKYQTLKEAEGEWEYSKQSIILYKNSSD